METCLACSRIKMKAKENALKCQGCVDKFIYVAFGAGFEMARQDASARFKTATEAWASFAEATMTLKNKAEKEFGKAEKEGPVSPR